MKINDVFDVVWDATPEHLRPKGEQSGRIILMACSIIAYALKQAGYENVLDDMAYIGDNYNIESIFLDFKKQDVINENKTIEDKKSKKGKKSQKDDASSKIENNEEETVDEPKSTN